ncbi:MAG TPA: 50S ribosomal protein L30 [Armatimonadota bacterium]|jgi:large subunit ribosomal protein L30
MSQIKVTLRKSTAGTPNVQRLTVQSLGLRRIDSCNVLPDNPAIRGMIHKVRHLVEAEPVEENQG